MSSGSVYIYLLAFFNLGWKVTLRGWWLRRTFWHTTIINSWFNWFTHLLHFTCGLTPLMSFQQLMRQIDFCVFVACGSCCGVSVKEGRCRIRLRKMFQCQRLIVGFMLEIKKQTKKHKNYQNTDQTWRLRWTRNTTATFSTNMTHEGLRKWPWFRLNQYLFVCHFNVKPLTHNIWSCVITW